MWFRWVDQKDAKGRPSFVNLAQAADVVFGDGSERRHGLEREGMPFAQVFFGEDYAVYIWGDEDVTRLMALLDRETDQ